MSYIYIHIYITRWKVIGLDPGKSNVATWVVRSEKHELCHRQSKASNGMLTGEVERYDGGTIFGGEWRFLSGKKRFTKKVSDICKEYRDSKFRIQYRNNQQYRCIRTHMYMPKHKRYRINPIFINLIFIIRI